jgi:hypothetical protein
MHLLHEQGQHASCRCSPLCQTPTVANVHALDTTRWNVLAGLSKDKQEHTTSPIERGAVPDSSYSYECSQALPCASFCLVVCLCRWILFGSGYFVLPHHLVYWSSQMRYIVLRVKEMECNGMKTNDWID